MTSSDHRITDPQRIRALTHPLRLELIDVLGDGPATATRCAAATGESVASCSFHLGILAKYGYIEPAERRGREKPWRLVTKGRDIRPDESDPASARAFEAMAGVYVEHEVEHTRRWLGTLADEPDAWTQASTLAGLSFWATAHELAEVSQAIQRLADRFAGRNDDVAQRPPGARPVRVFGAAHVDVAREDRNERTGRT